MQSTRLSLLIAVLALGFATWPVATTSSATVPAAAASSTAEELRLLSSLARWVSHPDSGPVVPQIALEREGFEVFRSWNRREQRREVVAELPWGPSIYEAAQRYGLDSLLVASVVEVESGFRSDRVSPRGALGLMQLMPDTAAELRAEDPTDPQQNLDAGARYLRLLIDRFDGDLLLALAAYNAGPNAVIRAGGVPPYRETQQYVEKVLARYVEHHRAAWRSNRDAEVLVFG